MARKRTADEILRNYRTPEDILSTYAPDVQAAISPQESQPESDDSAFFDVPSPPPARQSTPMPSLAQSSALSRLAMPSRDEAESKRFLQRLESDYDQMRAPLLNPKQRESVDKGSLAALGLSGIMNASPGVFYNNGQTYQIGPDARAKSAMAENWKQMMQLPMTTALREREKLKDDLEVGSKLEDMRSRVADRTYAGQLRALDAQQKAEALQRLRDERTVDSDFSRQRNAQFVDSNLRAADLMDQLDSKIAVGPDGKEQLVPSPLAQMFRKAAEWGKQQPRSAEAISKMEAENKELFNIRDKIEQRNVARETAQGMQGYRDAMLEATRSQQSATNALAWANYNAHRLDELRRAAEAAARLDLDKQKAEDQRKRDEAKKLEAHLTGPEAKLNRDITNMATSIGQMSDLLQIKKHVNTGPYVSWLRGAAEKVFGDAFTPNKVIELRALAANIFNEKLHELSGAAISPSEWARLAPQIPQESDDDRTFVIKLTKALQISKEIMAARMNEYQKTQGKPTDKSMTAAQADQMLNLMKGGASFESAFANTLGQFKMATEGQKTTSGANEQKLAAAKKVVASPSATPAQKKNAQAYIDAYGGE